MKVFATQIAFNENPTYIHLALCVRHVMRYCHLGVHVMAHLFQWRRSALGAHSNIANGRLQFATGIDDRLLLLLLICRDERCTVRLLRHAHLAGWTVGPRVASGFHVLIVVAHAIVWWKAWIRRHICLIRILAVVVHLLAAIQMVAIRIVAVHVRTHVRVGKV